MVKFFELSDLISQIGFRIHSEFLKSKSKNSKIRNRIYSEIYPENSKSEKLNRLVKISSIAAIL